MANARMAFGYLEVRKHQKTSKAYGRGAREMGSQLELAYCRGGILMKKLDFYSIGSMNYVPIVIARIMVTQYLYLKVTEYVPVNIWCWFPASSGR